LHRIGPFVAVGRDPGTRILLQEVRRHAAIREQLEITNLHGPSVVVSGSPVSSGAICPPTSSNKQSFWTLGHPYSGGQPALPRRQVPSATCAHTGWHAARARGRASAGPTDCLGYHDGAPRTQGGAHGVLAFGGVRGDRSTGRDRAVARGVR